jgi:uncharacterized protein (TIGR03083 family)
MNTTATRVEDIPKLGRPEAMRLARTEVDRMIEALRELSDEDWSRTTDCARWTVKDVIAHLIGMSEDLQSLAKLLGAQRNGKRRGKELGLAAFDGWTEQQVERHRSLSPGETLLAYEEAAPKLLQRRATANPVLRQVRFPQPPFGLWSMAYLLDDILTRDVWMHRADIAKATDRPMKLTAEHDGRFVANVVAELGRRWKGDPFTLELTGTAGGTYAKGTDGETFRLDAVEFCRILSGRGNETHPLHNAVPF